MLGRCCRGARQWRQLRTGASSGVLARRSSHAPAMSYTLLEQHFLEHDLEAPLMCPVDKALESSFRSLWNKEMPETRFLDIMKEWIKEGNVVTRELVDRLVVRMCAEQRYLLAYKLSDMVCRGRLFELSDHDNLLLLHLASCLGKEGSARAAFHRLAKKSELAFNRVIQAYADRNWNLTSETLFKQMKETVQITGPEAYEHMLGMYLRLTELDKAQDLVLEMEASGIAPSSGMYRKLLGYRELNVMRNLDANVEAFLAKVGGAKLKGQEWRNTIRIYGALGKGADVERMWTDMESGGHVPDRYYYAAAEAFGEAGRMDTFRQLCKQVESRNGSVRNDQCLTMIRVYAARGRMDKAEELFDLGKEVKLGLDVFHEMVAGHLKAGNVKLALERLQELLQTFRSHDYNKPVFPTVLRVMTEFVRSGDVATAEELMTILQQGKYRLNARLFNSLLQVYRAARKQNPPGFLKRMHRSCVLPDDDTLSLVQQLSYFQ